MSLTCTVRELEDDIDPMIGAPHDAPSPAPSSAQFSLRPLRRGGIARRGR